MIEHCVSAARPRDPLSCAVHYSTWTCVGIGYRRTRSENYGYPAPYSSSTFIEYRSQHRRATCNAVYCTLPEVYSTVATVHRSLSPRVLSPSNRRSPWPVARAAEPTSGSAIRDLSTNRPNAAVDNDEICENEGPDFFLILPQTQTAEPTATPVPRAHLPTRATSTSGQGSCVKFFVRKN